MTRNHAFSSLCTACRYGIAGVLALSSLAWSADEDGREVVASAYKRTQTATTVEEFTEILALCGEAAGKQQSEKLAAYTRQLQAWTHNRRGEVYTEQAATAHAAGDAFAAAQLDDLALKDFQSALQFDQSLWKPWLNRGVSYGIAGRHEEAVTDFTRVIELKPEEVDAWYNRAEILVELGRFEPAIADYDEVLRLAPDDHSALVGRAIARFRHGEHEGALEDLATAIEQQDTDPTVLVQRADMLQSLGRWEAAAADYRRAISLGPDSPLAYRATAWLMATCPEARFRNADLALQAAQHALELVSSPSWQLLDTLAAAHANAGHFDEAVRLIAQAVALSPPGQREAVRARAALYAADRPYRLPLVQTAELPEQALQR